MKRMVSATFVACVLLLVTGHSGAEAGRVVDRTISLTAKKFEFKPDQITAKKGEPVVLEIKSEDVTHGFSLPDFGVRGEVKPGSVMRVRFTPEKAGQFTFTCDVFCGSGHEDMSGTLTVLE
jgi:cytochrome c oxidase subunit II